MILRKRAWDVMREDFPHVDERATLADVMKILRESMKTHPEAHLVVVTSEKNKLRGVVTAWDVLKAAEAAVLRDEALKGVDETDWDAAFARACSICSGMDIDRLMHKDVPIVRPNDPLLLVLNALVESKRNWVVVEEGGKIIGLILIGDLYREVTRDMVKTF